MTQYVYNHEYRNPEYTNGWEKNYFGKKGEDFETLNALLQAISETEGVYDDPETDHRIVKEPVEKEKQVID